MTHRNLTPELAERISQLVAEADYILIGAGAGLSADAGYDYQESVEFLRRYPYLRDLGVLCRYHSIGFDWPTKAMQWAFYARHLQDVLFSPPPFPDPYIRLKTLTEHSDRWVLTSNADDLFSRMGFDPERIWTRQGTYAHLQCLEPCCDDVWESAPFVERLLSKVDLSTGELTEESVVPRCPRCGGDMMLNVRGGRWFIEKPYRRQQDAFVHWLESTWKGRLVVIEIGAGFNTPSVVRWPCEDITTKHPDAHLIRINLQYPETPDSLEGRSTSICDRGGTVLQTLIAHAVCARRSKNSGRPPAHFPRATGDLSSLLRKSHDRPAPVWGECQGTFRMNS